MVSSPSRRPTQKSGRAEADEGTGTVTALAGQCVRYGRLFLAVAWMSVLLPVMAVAAPYADYVIDARSGQVLHETNANTRLHPASLTKMMTLYIAFQAIERGEISLDSMITISPNAAGQAPSRLGLKSGQRIALRYLIRAAAVKSANDAAMAIGEGIGGSQEAFARRMNATAKQLGMTRSTFVNPNGLTAKGHLSTAHDMTMLGRHLFYDFPQYYGLFSRRTADAGIAQVASTNTRFLNSYKGADGIKTGYTGPAGFNLTASAQRGNKRIIATVFGGTSTAQRNAKVAELLDLGFGLAPKNTVEQKPQAPLYADNSADLPDSDEVAEAVAGTVSIEPGAVAKTIRVQGSVGSSPRPMARPVPGTQAPDGAAPAGEESPAAVLMAMQNNINDVLAEANAGPAFEQSTAPQPETEALAAAAAADETSVEPDSAADEAQALATTEPATDALDAIQPATDQAVASALADLQPAPETTEPNPEASDGARVAAAEAGTIRPRAAPPRPETAQGETVAAQAEAAPVTAAPEQQVADLALETMEPGAGVLAEAIPDTAPETAPQELAFVAAGAAMTPLPKPAMPAGQKVVRPADPAQTAAPADQIVVDAVAPATEVAEAEQEVVTRISTSGGHQWGINVGNFPSRYHAERQLLQVALLETNTLEDSLRKVVQRKGGFDANFLGLSQQAAGLACRRLVARGGECEVIGPG